MSSELPAAEISFLLGYDDSNSFYRAFHAWTGNTPDSVRTASLGELAKRAQTSEQPPAH